MTKKFGSFTGSFFSFRQIFPFRQICNLPVYHKTTGLQIRLNDKESG